MVINPQFPFFFFVYPIPTYMKDEKIFFKKKIMSFVQDSLESNIPFPTMFQVCYGSIHQSFQIFQIP